MAALFEIEKIQKQPKHPEQESRYINCDIFHSNIIQEANEHITETSNNMDESQQYNYIQHDDIIVKIKTAKINILVEDTYSVKLHIKEGKIMMHLQFGTMCGEMKAGIIVETI